MSASVNWPAKMGAVTVPAIPAPPATIRAPVDTDVLTVVFASVRAPSVPIAAAPVWMALPVVPLYLVVDRAGWARDDTERRHARIF